MDQIDMENFAGGALSEKFNIALKQVVSNLLDVNTSYKEKRKISIDITFTQDENREKVDVILACKSKLAPPMATQTPFQIGKDLRTNSIMATEYGAPTLPGNMKTVIGG